MLQSVVCIASPNMPYFEFGTICEVFGRDRSGMGGPVFDFRVVTAEPGALPLEHGLSLVVTDDLSAAATADLVAIAPPGDTKAFDSRVLRVVRDAVARGAWVLSVCSGAYVLAEAGVLDGKRATAHWMDVDDLARRYPRVEVDPGVLFVQSGNIVTSAGTAAGIDAALHIIRTEMGAARTNVIARRMVIPPQRDGGQAQYIEAPLSEFRADSFALVVEWALEHLDRELSIEELSRRAHMSKRTFARRFRTEMGTTPGAWLNRQRVIRAQQLIEETSLGLEEIAQKTGFGTSALMRHHFKQSLQISPAGYRRTFGPALGKTA